MSSRIFGEIPGIYEGFEFSNRLELSQSLVHRPTQADISGSQKEGADSIVLSGGYEDDEDYECYPILDDFEFVGYSGGGEFT
jgi:putative restriction endonuclease